MLAYYFPPDSSSGTFRPFFFANHLSNGSARVSVLTARESDFLPGQTRDPHLLHTLHPRVTVLRSRVLRPREAVLSFRDFIGGLFSRSAPNAHTHANTFAQDMKTDRVSLPQRFKDIITDFLASPDPQVGWIPGAAHLGARFIEEEKVDAIYATGSPWSSFLLGVLLKYLTGRPLLLDFRDPWVSNPGFVQRSRPAAWIERLMECFVLQRADGVVANTEELRLDFLERYDFLNPHQVHTIPNGFETYFDPGNSSHDVFTITHAGSLYFSRNPLQLIQALYNLVESGRIPAQEIRLMLVGGIDVMDEALEGLLASDPVRKIVQLTPRIPYSQAMSIQQASDVLLLMQQDFPLQVPRKLYEYMAMRRPILAVTDRDGATARIVNDYQLGRVVANTVPAIEDAIGSLYSDWKKGSPMVLPKGAADDFLNVGLAEKLADMVKDIIAKHAVTNAH